MLIRTYDELVTFQTYEDRYNYLRLVGVPGDYTFGYDRWMNQTFYRSSEWKRIRDLVIIRDDGCDLGIADRPITDKIIIHHMNPINVDDIKHSTENLMDPRYLVCCSMLTHNLIHYGADATKPLITTERKPNDTCPWRT